MTLNLGEEYRTLRTGVGLVRRHDSEFLSIHGKDAIDLLHRISTNDLRGLQDDETRSTVLVNEKGRILDIVTLIPTEDYFLVEVSFGNKPNIRQWIEKYCVTEDVEVRNPVFEISKYSLVGPRVIDTLKSFGFEAPKPTTSRANKIVLNDHEMIFVHDPLFPGPVWNLYSYHNIDNTVVERSGITVIDPEVFEVYRIEEAVPRHGKELTESVTPLEAGLRKFISLDKGCYLGQEVIARLDTYKKLKRKLIRFIGRNLDAVETGSEILKDTEPIGVVTSVIFSPISEHWVGLGYCSQPADSGVAVRASNGSSLGISIMDPPSTQE